MYRGKGPTEFHSACMRSAFANCVDELRTRLRNRSTADLIPMPRGYLRTIGSVHIGK